MKVVVYKGSALAEKDFEEIIVRARKKKSLWLLENRENIIRLHAGHYYVHFTCIFSQWHKHRLMEPILIKNEVLVKFSFSQKGTLSYRVHVKNFIAYSTAWQKPETEL